MGVLTLIHDIRPRFKIIFLGVGVKDQSTANKYLFEQQNLSASINMY
jgi:hypothetical protein